MKKHLARDRALGDDFLTECGLRYYGLGATRPLDVALTLSEEVDCPECRVIVAPAIDTSVGPL